MTSYEVSAVSAAPPRDVVALLVDGPTWPAWTPIDEVRVERDDRVRAPAGDQHPVVGEVRVVRTGRNFSRDHVVGAVVDRELEYVIHPDAIFRAYRGRVALSPGPSGGTAIRWRGDFRTRVPGTGWFWRRYLKRFLQRMVDGLAQHAAEPGRA